MRSVRIDDARWELFGQAVRNEREPHLRSRSALLRAFIDFYTGKANADAILPPDVKKALGMVPDA